MLQKERFYETWKHYFYKYKKADKALLPYLSSEIKLKNNWLKTARKALFLSTGEVAQRMGVSRSAYARLELSEKNMSPTIASMEKAAEAMGCDFVYVIKPKSGHLFSQVIWKCLKSRALSASHAKSTKGAQRDMVVARAAKRACQDFEFRRAQGWTLRH